MLNRKKKKTAEVEFLENIKEQIDTVQFGEGLQFNLHAISQDINIRLTKIKK